MRGDSGASRAGWQVFIRVDRDPMWSTMWLYREHHDGVEYKGPDGRTEIHPHDAVVPLDLGIRLPDDSVIALRDEALRVTGPPPDVAVVDQLRADLDIERARVDLVLDRLVQP